MACVRVNGLTAQAKDLIETLVRGRVDLSYLPAGSPEARHAAKYARGYACDLLAASLVSERNSQLTDESLMKYELPPSRAKVARFLRGTTYEASRQRISALLAAKDGRT